MKKLFLISVLCVGIVAWGGVSMATQFVKNGDFETGDLSDWMSSGGVSVVNTGSMYGYAALLDNPRSFGTEWLYQLFYVPQSVSKVDISFDYLFEGEDVARRLVDDSFTSGFAYLTDSFPFFGFDYLVEDVSSGSNFNKIVHFSRTVDLSSLYDNDPNAGIGFLLTELYAPTLAGLPMFVDGTDTQVYIDNVSVTSGPSPVPEPTTIFLSGLGLLGMGAFIRRRRRSKK